MAAVALRRNWRSASGAELVELAIVAPLLLVLVCGVVDFGFLFQSYEVISNAAREGARVGSLPGYTCPGTVEARVDQYLTIAQVPSGSYTRLCTPTTITTPGGQTFPGVRVDVTFTHQFQFLQPMFTLFGQSYRNGVTFTASAEMRSQATFGP